MFYNDILILKYQKKQKLKNINELNNLINISIYNKENYHLTILGFFI